MFYGCLLLQSLLISFFFSFSFRYLLHLFMLCKIIAFGWWSIFYLRGDACKTETKQNDRMLPVITSLLSYFVHLYLFQMQMFLSRISVYVSILKASLIFFVSLLKAKKNKQVCSCWQEPTMHQNFSRLLVLRGTLILHLFFALLFW